MRKRQTTQYDEIKKEAVEHLLKYGSNVKTVKKEITGLPGFFLINVRPGKRNYKNLPDKDSEQARIGLPTVAVIDKAGELARVSLTDKGRAKWKDLGLKDYLSVFFS